MTEFLESARQLGRDVERLWRAREYADAALPEIASAQLRRFLELNRFDLLAVSTALMGASGDTQLPEQLDAEGRFGDPPVTVWRGGGLCVDVYFWLDGTTSNHEHAFSGAFGVLWGSSVHRRARFVEDHAFNANLRTGEVELQPPEVLTCGDVRPIFAGASGAHSLFHLDHPSLSLVIRSARDPSSSIQYSYLAPGVAFNPVAKPVASLRRVAVARSMASLEGAKDEARVFADLLTRICEDPSMTLVERFFCVNEGLSVLPIPELDRVVDAVFGTADGPRTAIRQSFRTERRLREVQSLRGAVKESAARRTLAAMLSTTTANGSLSLVRQVCGVADPAEEIIRTLRLVASAGPEGGAGGGSLGAELDAAAWDVLEGLLRSGSPGSVMDYLASKYDPTTVLAQAENIRAACTTLASVPLLAFALRGLA